MARATSTTPREPRKTRAPAGHPERANAAGDGQDPSQPRRRRRRRRRRRDGGGAGGGGGADGGIPVRQALIDARRIASQRFRIRRLYPEQEQAIEAVIFKVKWKFTAKEILIECIICTANIHAKLMHSWTKITGIV